jgi:hypothetical protein
LRKYKAKQNNEWKRQNEKHDEPVACFQCHAGVRVGKKSGGVNHSGVDEAA